MLTSFYETEIGGVIVTPHIHLETPWRVHDPEIGNPWKPSTVFTFLFPSVCWDEGINNLSKYVLSVDLSISALVTSRSLILILYIGIK